ncbi:MAG: hypothetical protein H0T73_02510, partial [Ardenticatenales bacterium]|nr:hypothetical protein [Ardenticatenales bacterium]
MMLLLVSSYWIIFPSLAAYYWQPINENLGNQDVQALAATAGEPGTLYAGTWGGGVWRREANAGQWQASSDGLPLPFYVTGALAVSPAISTTLFVGDYYEQGIYRSTDSGISWSSVLTDRAVRALAIHPITPTLVLAGDREKGVYRSTDSGDTWSQSNAGLGSTLVNAIVIAPQEPGTIYLGAAEIVHRSDNGGASWAVSGVLSSSIQTLAVHPITPTLVYAGTRSDGIFRSADGGASWQSASSGLPAGSWVTSFASTPDGTLYAGAWGGQVYRSSDQGNTWEGLGTIGNVYAVLVDPANPTMLYAGTSNNGVFQGGTVPFPTPTPTPAAPTLTATITRTPTNTRTPTMTRTPTNTPTATRTHTPGPSPTNTRTPRSTLTATMTVTGTPPTAMATNTAGPSPTPTRTVTGTPPTATATKTNSPSPTPTRTVTGTPPTAT